jgi:hypothetical protein
MNGICQTCRIGLMFRLKELRVGEWEKGRRGENNIPQISLIGAEINLR